MRLTHEVRRIIDRAERLGRGWRSVIDGLRPHTQRLWQELSPDEMAFLEKDLKAHAAQQLKFIVSHQPSWLISVAFANPKFPLHQLAKKYGVRYIIAGHVHQLMRFDLDGITYLSLPSAGGHLRASKKYEDGWFFGWTRVDIKGTEVSFQIQDLESHKTSLKDWGLSGLKPKN